MQYSSRTKLFAEFLGTALLVATVVGSGIMGTALSSDVGLALLINAIATVLALGVLIFVFLPISGAQFNPAVTLVMLVRKDIAPSLAGGYFVAQITGAIAGAMLGNVMFGQPALQLSTNHRDSFGLLIGELVATAGLLFVILMTVARNKSNLLPLLVPAWIGAAYFFTSSTSFANPAVTIGRMFTESFSGIAPSSVPLFVVAQLIGALLGLLIALPFIRSTVGKD